jgi:hypothetical protein
LEGGKMMKRKRAVSSIVLCILALGCGSTAPLVGTAEDEKQYLRDVDKTGLAVTVSAADLAVAWSRAASFISKYSTMKIQTSTDFVIETYNPEMSRDALDPWYGYKVVKTPLGDGKTKIDVLCTRFGTASEDRSLRNARILSFYIETGRLMERFVSTGR